MQKSVFTLAHDFTAKWEGGYVNHPNDPGGATNYGVSLRWLKDEGIDTNGDGRIDVADIRALTPELAARLFKKHFWDTLKLDTLPSFVGIVAYDAAVNTGRGQAIRFLQRACNSFGGDRLPDDGVLGPKTLARVIGLVSMNFSLAMRCIEQREAFHKQLAANSPYPDGRDYRAFVAGWLNRTRDLKAYLARLADTELAFPEA